MIDESNTTNLEQTNHDYNTIHPEVLSGAEPQQSHNPLPVCAQQSVQPSTEDAVTCPRCGAAMDADADYCEVCRNYIKEDICSFCGAHIGIHAAYCPECGSPKAGMVCPVCRTMNEFAFCKQCGTPLTNEAKAMLHELQHNPLYRKMTDMARDLTKLDKILPYSSSKDIERETGTENLRLRVLTLLANDCGIKNNVPERHSTKRMTAEDLERRKSEIMERLSVLLEKISEKPMASPAKARNYAMACKPVGVRVAWMCNYKHAMHSSPCGCAKPQLGGKWIVFGKNNVEQIKDDN